MPERSYKHLVDANGVESFSEAIIDSTTAVVFRLQVTPNGTNQLVLGTALVGSNTDYTIPGTTNVYLRISNPSIPSIPVNNLLSKGTGGRVTGQYVVRTANFTVKNWYPAAVVLVDTLTTDVLTPSGKAEQIFDTFWSLRIQPAQNDPNATLPSNVTQGSQGAQGFQGRQGITGTGGQGAQGAQGWQGSVGAGVQGAQGNQGVIGTQGFQGLQGFQGAIGGTGVQGNQGWQGLVGFQGSQGSQGYQGATGATGSTGATGVQGFQGLQGNQGDRGPQGFQGAQGLQGLQGAQGNQGWQGATGSGGATPGGSDTQVQFNDGGSALGGDAGFTYDKTNDLATVTHLSYGVTQTDASGLLLTNTTAAANNAQQISPSIHWHGLGWKTDATAASQAVDFRAYVLPVQGTANPSGVFTLESSVNGGSYGKGLTYTSGGILNFPSDVQEKIYLTGSAPAAGGGGSISARSENSGSTGGAVRINAGGQLALTVSTGGVSISKIAGNGSAALRLPSGTGTYGNGIYFDGYDYTGDTSINKSADSGGNWSFKYDGTETLRDDGTNWRILESRRIGNFTNIDAGTSANPICRFGGNNKAKFADVASTNSTSIQNLDTTTLPAAMLTTNGDRIYFEMAFTFAANATTKDLIIKFGASGSETTIFDTSALAFNGGSATIYGTIMRTGAATQRIAVTFAGNTTLLAATSQYTAGAETLANALVLKATVTLGLGAAASDVVQKMLIVDMLPFGS